MVTVGRRLFLKAGGGAAGVALVVLRRPPSSKPRTKTLTDRGRATDQLTLAAPPDGDWADLWTDQW